MFVRSSAFRLCAGAAVAVLFAGCGSSDETTTTPTTDVPAASPVVSDAAQEATEGGTTLTDGARKLLEADDADDADLPRYTEALRNVGTHCSAGVYGAALIVDTAVSTLASQDVTVTRLAYLAKLQPSLVGKTNADCTDLSLTVQTAIADGEPVPSRVPVSTHPSVAGAPNLTDCPNIRWPVALPNDVVGQTLDRVTDELFCFNTDARDSKGYDPLEDASQNFNLGDWKVVKMTPKAGTLVGEDTPVLLKIKKR